MTYSTHLLRHLRFIIGQNIHRLRAKEKMPLRKLARLSGVPELLLDHYELGKNEIRLDELLKIACVLEVEVGELIIYPVMNFHHNPNSLLKKMAPLR